MRASILAFAGLLPAPLALAQENPTAPDPPEARPPAPDPPEARPPAPDPPEARSPAPDPPEVRPPAPTVAVPSPAKAVRTFAGVGSGTPYGAAGVAEAGGALSLSTANGVTTFSADPTLGYFAVDNVELSGTVGIRHLTVEGEHSNQFSMLAEPSLHLPFDDGLFWFLGLGLGLAVIDTSRAPVDVGLAMAPRTGVQILLGRSGVLNLGIRYSAVLSDVDRATISARERTVLAFANTLDLQGGYTVMF